jgi:hypothetical protein
MMFNHPIVPLSTLTGCIRYTQAPSAVEIIVTLSGTLTSNVIVSRGIYKHFISKLMSD